MDDNLTQAFGGPQPKTSVEEAWHREQERKKYDIIRVSNPTPKDFYVKYDTGRYQKIAANSTADIPRYMAIRYLTHMKDQILHEEAERMHDEYIAERDAKGLPRYTDKATENKETYETQAYPKTNDPVLIQKVFSQLWVGLVYEFGRDIPPEQSQNDPRSGEVDLTPPEIRIMEKLDNKRIDFEQSPVGEFQSSEPPAVSVSSPFSKLNEALTPGEINAAD